MSIKSDKEVEKLKAIALDHERQWRDITEYLFRSSEKSYRSLKILILSKQIRDLLRQFRNPVTFRQK